MNAERSISQRVTEALLLFLMGGVLYYGIELLYRGWSHWSMALCGALCFQIIYRVEERSHNSPLILRALRGALLITPVEFVFGCILNRWLKLGIWDYSDLPFQLLGQICLPYSILWFLLCIPLCELIRWVREVIFYGTK